MCGILGWFSKKNVINNADVFQSALDLIKYRGPDGQGIIAYSNLNEVINLSEISLADKCIKGFLGHRRLSIIDLSNGGCQPMVDPLLNLSITFNGEIYNYKELKSILTQNGYRFSSDSDTEVILKAYHYWGSACVQHFRGMWAFGIIDLNKNQLFLSRDRFGIKPLYYSKQNDEIVFSSEIKQIRKIHPELNTVNKSIIFDYLKFGIVDHSEDTFFQDILRLEPGHNAFIDLESLHFRSEKYYQLSATRTDMDFDGASEIFHDLFCESLKLHLVSDVKIGALLSGGLDSSAIVSCIKDPKVNGQIFLAFSSQFDESEANELNFAEIVADQAQIDMDVSRPSHNELLDELDRVVVNQDEPFGSTSILAQYFLFKRIKERNFKVVLDGQGADEMLAGYIGLAPAYYKELWVSGKITKLIWEGLIRGHIGPRVKDKALKHLGGFNGINRDWMSQDFLTENRNSAYLSTIGEQFYGDKQILNNSLYNLFFKTNLPGLLRYEDRNSMISSVESRVPFLDHKLVEFIFSLPSNFKIRNGYTKAVLRNGLRDNLPTAIRNRRTKLGFATPENKWLGGELKHLYEASVHSERLQPYINSTKFQEYFGELQRHRKTDFAIWRAINLDLWLRNLNQ